MNDFDDIDNLKNDRYFNYYQQEYYCRERSQVFSIRLPRELFARLNAYCEYFDTNRNKVISELILDMLDECEYAQGIDFENHVHTDRFFKGLPN